MNLPETMNKTPNDNTFVALQNEILHLLQNGLPKHLHYHNVQHTFDVLQSSQEIAEYYKLITRDKWLLQAAALLHDTGLIRTYEGHEEASADIAHSKLAEFGFDQQEIDQVCDIILATKMPQQPNGLLAEILCDADLDYLGRKDFFLGAHKLRLEWMQVFKHDESLKKWYRKQFEFLSEHKYFTVCSQQSRESGKQQNMQLIKGLLDL